MPPLSYPQSNNNPPPHTPLYPKEAQMKKWLVYLRRRWCLWRDHPQSFIEAPVLSTRTADIHLPDGSIVPGVVYAVHAYRCLIHDYPDD